MASQVDICNTALSHCGVRQRIGSLTEASEEARLFKLVYQRVLERTLRQHKWEFATKRKALVLIEEDPNLEWKYRYAIPNDCVKAQAIELPGRNLPTEHLVRWKIESMPDDPNQRTILTDKADAILIYTRNDIPTGLYPEHFTMLLEWNLAAAVAMPLTMKVEVGQYTIVNSKEAKLEAAALDSNTGQPDDAPLSEFVRARE